MKRFAPLSLVAGLFLGIGVAHAQEAVTIKLKERGENQPAVVKRNEATKTKLVVTDGNGNVVLDQNEIKVEIMEYKETFLKREEGKRPTKVEREYTKAESGKDKEIENGELHGKTVIIERKKNDYTFKYKDGETVEGAAAKILAKDFSNKSDSSNKELEKLVLPGKAVKPGESWKLEMPKIIAELGKEGAMELNAAKSTGTGTLVKTYKTKGGLYGEMKYKMEMPIVTIGKGQEQLKFAAGAKIVMELTLNVCIDGSADEGKMKMKMLLTGDAAIPAAPGANASLNVTVDSTQEQVESKK